MDRSIIGNNLRMFRLAKRLSQKELAMQAGLSSAGYRNIETGDATPRVDTLQRIAEALEINIQELLKPPYQLAAVRFRAQKKLKNREQVLVEVANWMSNYLDLESILGEEKTYRLGDLARDFHAGDDNSQRAVRTALEARNRMGLKSNEIIRDICGLFESEGIKVCAYRSHSTNFFGLSIGIGDGGPAIVITPPGCL